MLGLSQLLLSPGSLWLIDPFVLMPWFQSPCSQNTCSKSSYRQTSLERSPSVAIGPQFTQRTS